MSSDNAPTNIFPETIGTPRLLLRKIRLEDAAAIYHSYAQDTEVTRYLIWRPHRDIRETEDYIRSCLDGWERGSELTWVIASHDGNMVGAIAIRLQGHMADVGYVLTRAEWGKGYMTEALRSLIGRTFSSPEMFRVWATCDVENLASARVLEKAGMQREGILRRFTIHPNIDSEPRDAYCYAVTR